MYHLDTSLLSPSVEVPDEFFEVTVQDVQRIHDDHKKQLYVYTIHVLWTLKISSWLALSLFPTPHPSLFLCSFREAFSDAPLMTQAMKAAQMEKKYGRYDKAVIRVHFPDRWVLQGCFRPRESCECLYP